MWDGVRSPDSKGIASSFTRRRAMKGNETEDKKAQGKKNPNTSKARGSNPREIFSRRGLLSKGLTQGGC
jgi:hypothetical protein